MADGGALVNAYIDKLSHELLDAVRGRALGQARADVAEAGARQAVSERDGLAGQVVELRDALERCEAERAELARRCASMRTAITHGSEDLARENSELAARMSNMEAELVALRETVRDYQTLELTKYTHGADAVATEASDGDDD